MLNGLFYLLALRGDMVILKKYFPQPGALIFCILYQMRQQIIFKSKF
jgi:hypothetical protein